MIVNPQTMINNPRHKNNLIINLSFAFSLNVIRYTEELQTLKKFNLANQLFRSGTSIGANVREAQNAESKPDFVHKMKIAMKEVEETVYWLMLCHESEFYPDSTELIKELGSISRVMNKIISATKQRMKR